MPTPKKKRKKTKRKGTFELSVYQFVRLKKKSENNNGKFRQMDVQPPRTASPVFKVRIKRKHD